MCLPHWQTVRMNTFRFMICIAVAAVFFSAALPAAEPVQREIIPGSELMTTQERERYRLRLRGAGTATERERLRAEHVRAMEERARLQGLKVIDYSRDKAAK